MKKKNLIGLLLVILALFITAGCGNTKGDESIEPTDNNISGDSAIAPIIIKLGHCDAEDENDSNHNYAAAFKKNCAELSNGSIQIEIYGNQQLGGERDMLEQMQLGTLDMMNMTNVNIAPFYSGTMLFDLPYFFEDADAAFYLIDSEIGQKVLDNMEEKIGVKALSTGYAGFRQVYNNKKAITVPEDMVGMKLRVPESKLYINAFEAIKASPTPMAWTETFTAVQQGVLDGLECPITVCYNSSIYEFTKYASVTNHIFSCIHQLIKSDLWEGLDDNQREVIQQASEMAAQSQRKFIRENESKYLDLIAEKGVEITNTEYEKFRELASSVWPNFNQEIGKDILDKAVDYMNKYQ